MEIQVRPTKNYLIIGNIHLGFDRAIMQVLSNASRAFNAEVIHLGSVITEDERKVYQHKVRIVKALELELDEVLSTETKKIKKLKYNEALSDASIISKKQLSRIRTLHSYFPNISFVINPEQHIGFLPANCRVLGNEYHISKYIMLSSVSANGDKISYSPITDRSFQYFMTKSSSFIVPHPTPCIESFNKQGVNNTRLFATTGSLKETSEPLKASELYKVVNDPSAVLLSVDEDGRFHISRLNFETIDGYPAILLDGLVITKDEIMAVDGEDKAVVSSDDHAPYHSVGVLRSVQALTLLHKPKTFINAGDACDFNSICPHNAKNLKAQENKRLKNDLDSLRNLLLEQTKYMPKDSENILIDSNHHKWLTRKVEENPYLIGLLDWGTISEQLNFKVMLAEDKEVYKWGDLYLAHGHQEKSMKNGHKIFYKYLCGHWHAWNEFRGLSGTMGAGCGLEPDYLDGAMNAWSNTVTTLTKYQGKTRFAIKSVLMEGDYARFVYRGVIREVDWVINETDVTKEWKPLCLKF